MRAFRSLLILAVCYSSLGAAPVPKAITMADIAKLIQQLGDDDFQAREEASQKLWRAGSPAEPALRKALTSDDPEVRRRAQELLDKFALGIYPDTPPNVVALIREYPGANDTAKGVLVGKLLALGKHGVRAVFKIAENEKNATTRKMLMAQVANNVGRTIPLLLAEADFEMLELLLELGLREEDRAGMRNYVAYWMMRGKLDERIAHFLAKKAQQNPGDEQQLTEEILAYFYRAKGETKLAKEAALRAAEAELVESILYEAGDWKTLAGMKTLANTNREVERLGYHAAYTRLANDEKAFEAAVKDLLTYAKNVEGDSSELFLVAKALFLNDRADDGIETLQKTGRFEETLFNIFLAQHRHKNAIAVVEQAKMKGASSLAALEIRLAKTYYQMGEKEKANALLAEYVGQLKPGNEASWYQQLVATEYSLGMREKAFAHAAAVLKFSADQGWPSRFFDDLFPNREETAGIWWKYLRLRNAGQDTTTLMKRLRALMDGKADKEEVTALITGADEELKKLIDANNPTEADRWYLALAEVAGYHKLNDLAKKTLEKATTPGAMIELGDLLAKEKNWERAATRYQQAWDNDRREPLALYLRGWALSKAGKTEEGKKLIELSHWIPLGDDTLRHEFSDALFRRGFDKDGYRENNLILQLGEPGSYYVGEAFRKLGTKALAKKDYLLAADCQSKAMLRVLRGFVSFIQDSAYVGVPAMVHSQRAAGLVAAGKIEEGLAAARTVQTNVPGNTDMPIRLVPLLEEKGLKKEADKVFERSLEAQAEFCKVFPNSSTAHNSYAWLCACCRRNLDKGLVHAQKANELNPDHAGHLDTLAEVYFQKGDTKKAIEIQTKVVQLDPDRPYFRKQLARFKAGDPKADLPPEED